MDSKERQIRQREFTIYLVLFILLVIVGAITTNGQAIDGRRYESPYGNPYYHGGYSGSPYGYYYSGYNEYGTPYYGRTPSYAWNQLNGYGNGPPFYPNTHPMYGSQGYGQVHQVFGPQWVHQGWGYNGGAQVHPGYGYPPVGFNNSYYRPPAPPMMPHMVSPPSYRLWGNELRMMGPNHPFQPMREHSNFMGPYNVEGYGQPFFPQMQHPYNQAWW
jgi:hypothetical protein